MIHKRHNIYTPLQHEKSTASVNTYATPIECETTKLSSTVDRESEIWNWSLKFWNQFPSYTTSRFWFLGS